MSSTETAMNSFISSLIKHGNKLSCQLRHAKISRESLPDTKLIVEEVIHQILESLSNPDDQLPNSFPGKVVIKVLEKIQDTLQNFAKHDSVNAVEYIKLEKTVNDFKNKNWSSTSISFSALPDEQRHSESPAATDDDDTSGFSHILWNDRQNPESYEKLDTKVKKCLSLCFSLFPNNDVPLVELSKRQLIHWWTGLGIIESPKEGEDVLANLVEEEYIIMRSSAFSSSSKLYSSSSSSKLYSSSSSSKLYSSSSSSKLYSSSSRKYVMPTRSKVHQDKQFMLTSRIQVSDQLLCLTRTSNTNETRQGDSSATEVKTEGIAVAINTDIYLLNADTCGKFTGMNNVEIVHLGSWPYNPKKYVVVDDIGYLRNMTRNWKNVTSLSFQGIAGIVELPDTVYKLQTLKVLDLKACPNLEYLPNGINSLKNLTHLDVSECYLLNHIPKEAASLKNLRVLKGFIINPETPDHSNDQCILKELSGLENLEKLAIRARIVNFPTNEDLETLCQMRQLRKLKVTWVINKASQSHTYSAATVSKGSDSCTLALPDTLEKLELQAAPKTMALQLLNLIGYRSRNCPVKLCIRGGGLRKLEPYKYCFLNVKTLSLRYLPKLHMKWSDLQQLFPNLSHLDVYECPNLIFFPSGNNGQWNKSEQS